MAARLAADAEPIPGYRLLERLGRGGFGEVWKVLAPGGMPKAIKFVYGNLNESADSGRPAEQELKALHRVKSIRHPYILSLERFDVIDGQLLIVMELADRNLHDRFRECQEQGLPGIPRDELMRYMEEAAEALDLMNGQFQLQHLDIKPQNIFLVFNHIKVADFGLAKDLEGMQATLTGGVTPVYAAPETFECRVTRFCDQYSLAIVYQELLTGERPFNGATARQLMMQHLQAAPDLSSLPLYDRSVIGRALSKDPEQRFPTCAEMVQALKTAPRPAPTRALPQPARTPVPADAAPARTPPTLPGACVKPRSKNGLRPSAAGLPSLGGSPKLPPLVNARPANMAAARQAPPEKTGDGVLLPALVVGVGRYGLLVLQRLRRTLRDRFGTASLPHLRLLYIDTEAETVQSVSSSSAAIDPGEIFLARLNRPSHYTQSRPDLPPVATWLNPNLLYRLPRQPATTGIRAFGRLALCDHYRALMAKVRGELEACTADDALRRAAEITGGSLRSNRPRVYVVTSLMGGTGGGMFLDLAYALRQQLRLLGYNCPEVHGLLYVPHVDGALPQSQAVANAYAALTELFHYNTPSAQFEATFDPKEGPIVDRERPFQRCLLLPVPNGGDGPALRPALGTGAAFLFQELLTPIGREADKVRGETTRAAGVPAHLQTCGTFRLTWPRRALLERAARRGSAHVVAGWAAREAPQLAEPVRHWVGSECAPWLDLESMTTRLRAGCRDALSDDPLKVIDAIIDPLADEGRAATPEMAQLCPAVEQLTQLVGKPEGDPAAEGGRLGQALDQAARALAAEGCQELTALAFSAIERPGWRLAGVEEVVRQSAARLKQAVESGEERLSKLRPEARDAYAKAFALLATADAAGRGTRRAVAAREALAQFRHYARTQAELLTLRALVKTLQTLVTFGPDCLRDVQLYRQKLETLRQLLARPGSSGSTGHLGPERPVLPAGCRDLDEAADRIISELGATDAAALEEALLEQVRKQCKSLGAYVADKADQSRGLAALFIEQARAYFEPRLPASNPAAVLLGEADWEAKARRELDDAFATARPALVPGAAPREDELCVVAVPAGEEGDRFGAAAQEALSAARPLAVTGTAGIVIVREVQSLAPSDLPQLGPAAREAFARLTKADQATPHTRDDVNWQPVPLE